MLGLWGAALVGSRPEAAVTVAVLSLSAAYFMRGFGRSVLWRVVVLSALPGALVVAGGMLANYVMTGEPTAAGALASPFSSTRNTSCRAVVPVSPRGSVPSVFSQLEVMSAHRPSGEPFGRGMYQKDARSGSLSCATRLR